MEITLSVIKADVGGYVGHSSCHPDVLQKAKESLERAKGKGLLIDYHVMACGDDLQLIMTHQKGEDNEEIHKLAWDTFVDCTNIAKRLKLHGAGQDLLADAFSGNVRAMGPGVAEMYFTERESETIVIFMADKTASGAWNLPLYKIFADPFNTIGLVIAPNMHSGFTFEVHDVTEKKKIMFNAPEEIYDMLVFIGSPHRYAVKAVYHKESGEIAASSSTQHLALIAGRYVGKDDPVCIVRAQGKFPAVGEILEPFASPNIVKGWMRGSHHGPLMPVSFCQARATRFDGPPRVIAAGFQLANGKFVGPNDLFDDPAFDLARQQANEIANFLRRLGPFEPHRLPLDEMEYTTMPEIAKKLAPRFKDM
ncbi:MAG: fructose 1,6-bisphosphatase [Chloroflexi bacterium CG08_land_8_20_14_0_20_45_12]|nr:MAG: fructose 1,6-bisphosphatase [Chloroflexi bacterium CG08_land_8_20_14_0_20_45_12]